MTSNLEHIEHRLVCNAHGTKDRGHRSHVWKVSPKNMKTDALADAFIATRNADPVMSTPAWEDCWPMRIEARYHSDWTDDFDRLKGLME